MASPKTVKLHSGQQLTSRSCWEHIIYKKYLYFDLNPVIIYHRNDLLSSGTRALSAPGQITAHRGAARMRSGSDLFYRRFCSESPTHLSLPIALDIKVKKQFLTEETSMRNKCECRSAPVSVERIRY